MPSKHFFSLSLTVFIVLSYNNMCIDESRIIVQQMYCCDSIRRQVIDVNIWNHGNVKVRYAVRLNVVTVCESFAACATRPGI